jgi:hypothetical protein
MDLEHCLHWLLLEPTHLPCRRGSTLRCRLFARLVSGRASGGRIAAGTDHALDTAKAPRFRGLVDRTQVDNGYMMVDRIQDPSVESGRFKLKNV